MEAMHWKADVEWRDDLLQAGSDGKVIMISDVRLLILVSGVNHGIAQDGRVAILTVNKIS